jgi:hypothetical protein
MATEHWAGCSKRSSSTAAASEGARRTGDPLLSETQRVEGTLRLRALDPLHIGRKQWVPQQSWRPFSTSCYRGHRSMSGKK